jgi:hypothetical protein
MINGRRLSVAPAASPWKILASKCPWNELLSAPPMAEPASKILARMKTGRRPMISDKGRKMKFPIPDESNQARENLLDILVSLTSK